MVESLTAMMLSENEHDQKFALGIINQRDKEDKQTEKCVDKIFEEFMKDEYSLSLHDYPPSYSGWDSDLKVLRMRVGQYERNKHNSQRF